MDVYDGKADGRKTLFDDAKDHEATPDVVLQRPDETTPLVCEVKNVPGSGAPKREAINQAVTYALRYRSGQVVLVTPCTQHQVSSCSKLGRIDQVVVYHYRLNLGAEDLEVEETDFAAAMAGLLQDHSEEATDGS